MLCSLKNRLGCINNVHFFVSQSLYVAGSNTFLHHQGTILCVIVAHLSSCGLAKHTAIQSSIVRQFHRFAAESFFALVKVFSHEDSIRCYVGKNSILCSWTILDVLLFVYTLCYHGMDPWK